MSSARNIKKTYLGNPKIKRAGVTIEWSEDQIKEYAKCVEDPLYFIKTYTRIVNVDRGLIPFEMYDYQEDMVKVLHENKRAIIRCSRQIGKCFDIYTIIRLRYKKKYIIEIEVGKLYELFKNSRTTELTPEDILSYVIPESAKKSE
jgi:hypothetical protein